MTCFSHRLAGSQSLIACNYVHLVINYAISNPQRHKNTLQNKNKNKPVSHFALLAPDPAKAFVKFSPTFFCEELLNVGVDGKEFLC